MKNGINFYIKIAWNNLSEHQVTTPIHLAGRPTPHTAAFRKPILDG